MIFSPSSYCGTWKDIPVLLPGQHFESHWKGGYRWHPLEEGWWFHGDSGGAMVRPGRSRVGWWKSHGWPIKRVNKVGASNPQLGVFGSWRCFNCWPFGFLRQCTSQSLSLWMLSVHHDFDCFFVAGPWRELGHFGWWNSMKIPGVCWSTPMLFSVPIFGRVNRRKKRCLLVKDPNLQCLLSPICWINMDKLQSSILSKKKCWIHHWVQKTCCIHKTIIQWLSGWWFGTFGHFSIYWE